MVFNVCSINWFFVRNHSVHLDFYRKAERSVDEKNPQANPVDGTAKNQTNEPQL